MLNQIKKQLKFLYPESYKDVFSDLLKIIKKYKRNPLIKAKTKKYKNRPLFSEKDIFIITYGNSIIKKGEKPLKTLYNFFKKHIKNSITGIHILPFFSYSSDDGFSVVDYKKVNPELGEWQDIERIGKKYRLMVDLVINHCSSKSYWFQEFLKGNKKYKDFFISFEKKPNTDSVFRPRTSPLLTSFKTKMGRRYVWTTFSKDQIDLNFKNPKVLLEMVDIMLFYISKSAEIIRLDAIGFLWKKLGTKCLHLKECHEIVKLFRNILKETAPYAAIITETNVPYKENISYFGSGNDEAHLVYNFSLPPLVLDAFLREDSLYLKKLLKKTEKLKKQNLFFNFLASHDGIGILAAKDYLNDKQFKNMLKTVKKHNGYISYKSTKKGNIPYELNINYFDALNGPNSLNESAVKRFITAQSIIVFLKGVPGIYIHSILGSRNYNKGVKISGIKRRINREKLNYDLLEKELTKNSLRKKILKNYLFLIKERQKNKDFNPYSNEKVIDSSNDILIFQRNGKKGTKVIINLKQPCSFTLQR